MSRKMLGILAAGAAATLIGSTAFAEGQGAGSTGGDAKACYRTDCGKSIKGHEGKCGGTKVEGISVEKACTDAGGAWTTAEDAKQYAK